MYRIRYFKFVFFCLPCYSNWTWFVGETTVFCNKLRSKHCTEFPYLDYVDPLTSLGQPNKYLNLAMSSIYTFRPTKMNFNCRKGKKKGERRGGVVSRELICEQKIY